MTNPKHTDTSRDLVERLPALRHWLWVNFGYDIYEWGPDDIRF